MSFLIYTYVCNSVSVEFQMNECRCLSINSFFMAILHRYGVKFVYCHHRISSTFDSFMKITHPKCEIGKGYLDDLKCF